MDYDPNTTYVLTAPRCRASWKVVQGMAVLTKSKRIKRGEELTDIPEDQIARLVALGHAVPKDEYDPAALKKISAARRLAMTQAAAADASAAVAAAQASSGQPLVGLEDAAPKADTGTGTTPANPGDGPEVDGIVSEDINGVAQPGDVDDDGDDTGIVDKYTTMSYPDLQREAKEKTGNGGGSGDELRERLREHDAQQ